MSAIKFIYRKLLDGEVFGRIEEHRMGGTYFWDVLSADKEYIYWRHYGEGANKTIIENLRWILKNIFEMTPEEFLYNYTTYHEYCRIDECYTHEQV